MRIAFIRGQYLNNFELQSYTPILSNHKDIEFTGFTSLKPLHQVNIPIVNLPSPVDLPNFPYKIPILNRLFIDAMYLYNLELNLENFDIAHVRETYFHFSSQAIKAQKKGNVKKVLVTCSETIPFNHETIPGRHNLKQFVIKNADHFHTLTHKAKDCLIKEGVAENKITVIPYGVDLNTFKPLKNKKPNKILRLLFIGRLEDQKGINELLESWQILKKEFSNLDLKIIGKGPLESKLHQYNLKNISLPYSQIPLQMQQADILVLPSKPTKYWEEYFGMVLIEAMATGLPIVTTNSGAIPEVVKDSAVVVPHSNSHKLYKGLKELVKNQNLRQELSKSGLLNVKQSFDTNKQSQKLYQLYKNLI
jgi:starch synthase